MNKTIVVLNDGLREFIRGIATSIDVTLLGDRVDMRTAMAEHEKFRDALRSAVEGGQVTLTPDAAPTALDMPDYFACFVLLMRYFESESGFDAVDRWEDALRYDFVPQGSTLNIDENGEVMYQCRCACGHRIGALHLLWFGCHSLVVGSTCVEKNMILGESALNAVKAFGREREREIKRRKKVAGLRKQAAEAMERARELDGGDVDLAAERKQLRLEQWRLERRMAELEKREREQRLKRVAQQEIVREMNGTIASLCAQSKKWEHQQRAKFAAEAARRAAQLKKVDEDAREEADFQKRLAETRVRQRNLYAKFYK